jgi:hypothetical protein
VKVAVAAKDVANRAVAAVRAVAEKVAANVVAVTDEVAKVEDGAVPDVVAVMAAVLRAAAVIEVENLHVAAMTRDATALPVVKKKRVDLRSSPLAAKPLNQSIGTTSRGTLRSSNPPK